MNLENETPDLEPIPIEIMSNQIEIVDISLIKRNPENNNRHSIEQITALSKIIMFNGFRDPLIVSKRSGMLVCGEGRLEAALLLGMKVLPIVRQDFRDEKEEYQFLTAHNEISAWSELDFHSFKVKTEDWGFDDELFGLKRKIPKAERKMFSIVYKDDDELLLLQGKFQTDKKSVQYEEASECLDLTHD